MLEKIILMTLIYLPLYFLDAIKLKEKTRHEILIYSFFILISLYLCFKYVFGVKWFDLYDIIELILGKTAQSIVDYLNVTD